jgi:succinate dehydrogenase hydrophobic anchor subunit
MGVRTVIVDYVKGRARTLLLTGLYLLAFILFALGTAVVMTLPVVPKG